MNELALIEQMDALSRERELTPAESLMLERAVRRSGRKQQRPWLPKDILKLRHLVRKRKRWNEIAEELNRTPHAVGRMMAKLREQGKCGYISPVGSTGRYPRKSSKADAGREGIS